MNETENANPGTAAEERSPFSLFPLRSPWPPVPKFFICVHLLGLRAIPDSVAADRAVPSAVQFLWLRLPRVALGSALCALILRYFEIFELI